VKRGAKKPAWVGAGTPLTVGEVLDRLAQIELEGIEFYKGLMRGTEFEWVRKLSEMMITAEQRHHDRFTQYAAAARASSDPADNALTDALPAQVMSLMSEKVFVTGDLAEKAGHNVDERRALVMGIQAEKNTVLLLSQLGLYVPRNQRGYINQVIKEEQNHQARLESLYRKHFA
jgi:rubrerythrin